MTVEEALVLKQYNLGKPWLAFIYAALRLYLGSVRRYPNHE